MNKLKAVKVSSMGYNIVNNIGDAIAYVKKVGFNKYRLTIDEKQLGYYDTVEACITRLAK